ncbi:OmpH family outer membrane protein [Seonamhaeicola maritimus]|uniref:OmpH family outer membrane protein n=1 Tax=Seonamhaeicola maritimus TaxID=2591822 RepID=A0A5C7GID0_9FLAO|nr:OmpH family outer membrane protein [Seonamhaeicola maritimus]TXG38336.1 OmpH family outer membrane protein [Seonamhaeicola maritimus]
MKQLKTILLATAVCIGSISFSQAQSKVAHINTQELIQAMPGFKSAQTELEALQKTYTTDIQNSITELQNLQKQYQAEAPNKTDEENQKRVVELQEKEQRIAVFQQDAQKSLAEKRAELLKPVEEEAMKAINEVAKAQGFNYVLDRATLIVAEGTDILAAVKTQLGI